MPQLTTEHTSLIGKESQPRSAAYAINDAMAHFWCEMVEDLNPIYFDEGYARGTWLKEPFAPPAMLFTWGMQPVWPEEDRHREHDLSPRNSPAAQLRSPSTPRRNTSSPSDTATR